MNQMENLLAQMQQLVTNIGGEVGWFAAQMEGLVQNMVSSQCLPVCGKLHKLQGLASKHTKPVVEAIISTAPLLCWQQSYSAEDGFDRAYLDNYGWFNLVAPQAVFESDIIRVSVGYWGEGLLYREHWHEPEEFYVVLAGGGRFSSKAKPSRWCTAGDVVHYLSNQKHAIEMTNGPLLAAAFWRGNALVTKPQLEALT